MRIRKSNTQMDIEGLMNEIDADHQIGQEEANTDKRLKELQAAQMTLKEATESLRQATTTLHETVTALNEAKANVNNVTASFNKVIADAQENTKFKVHFEREDLKQMMNLSMAALKTDEIMMKQHRDQQLKNLEIHERKVAKILSRNEGVWFSDFWVKVLCWVIGGCTLIMILYVFAKTHP